MMHSHDRTQIVQYGFGDPDKRNSRHDLACQYLAQKEVAQRLVRRYWTRLSGEEDTATYGIRVRNEEPLTKGEGQYKTVVGFFDLTYTFKFVDGCDDADYLFLIEVKCDRISVSDILRQIKFYQESIKNCSKYYTPEINEYKYRDRKTHYYPLYDEFVWVVVLDFDISALEEKMFFDEDILVLKLGADFDRWISDQAVSVNAADADWDASGVE